MLVLQVNNAPEVRAFVLRDPGQDALQVIARERGASLHARGQRRVVQHGALRRVDGPDGGVEELEEVREGLFVVVMRREHGPYQRRLALVITAERVRSVCHQRLDCFHPR